MAATRLETHNDRPVHQRTHAISQNHHDGHHRTSGLGHQVQSLGGLVTRYGLALVFLWFGAMKFTAYEAAGIAPFIMNSPVIGWVHASLGIQGASYLLGVIEIAIGLLLAIGPAVPLLGVLGGAMAVVTFLVTLTFFVTTPGVAESRAGGFPAISAEVGQFLLKDVVLLGASIWALGDALSLRGRRAVATQR